MGEYQRIYFVTLLRCGKYLSFQSSRQQKNCGMAEKKRLDPSAMVISKAEADVARANAARLAAMDTEQDLDADTKEQLIRADPDLYNSKGIQYYDLLIRELTEMMSVIDDWYNVNNYQNIPFGTLVLAVAGEVARRRFAILKAISALGKMQKQGETSYEAMLKNMRAKNPTAYAERSWTSDTSTYLRIIAAGDDDLFEVLHPEKRLKAIAGLRQMLAQGEKAYTAMLAEKGDEERNWLDDMQDLLKIVTKNRKDNLSDQDMGVALSKIEQQLISDSETRLKRIEVLLRKFDPLHIFKEEALVDLVDEKLGELDPDMADMETIMAFLDDTTKPSNQAIRDGMYQLVEGLITEYANAPFQRLFKTIMAQKGFEMENTSVDITSLNTLRIDPLASDVIVPDLVRKSATATDVVFILELINKAHSEWISLRYLTELAARLSESTGTTKQSLSNILVTFELITNANLLDVLYFTNMETFECVAMDTFRYIQDDRDDDKNESAISEVESVDDIEIDDILGPTKAEDIDSADDGSISDSLLDYMEEDELYKQHEKKLVVKKKQAATKRVKTPEEIANAAARRAAYAREKTIDNTDTLLERRSAILHFENIMLERGVKVTEFKSSRSFFSAVGHYVLGLAESQREAAFQIIANAINTHLLLANVSDDPILADKWFEECDKLLFGKGKPVFNLDLVGKYLEVLETQAGITWLPDEDRYTAAFHVYRIFHLGYFGAGFGYDRKPGILLDSISDMTTLEDQFDTYGQAHELKLAELYRGAIEEIDFYVKHPGLTAAEQYWHLLGDEACAFFEAVAAQLEKAHDERFATEKAWWYSGKGRYPFWKGPLATYKFFELNLDFTGKNVDLTVDNDPEEYIRTRWGVVNSWLDWAENGIPAASLVAIDSIAEQGMCLRVKVGKKEDDVLRITRDLEASVYTMNPMATEAQHAKFRAALVQILRNMDDPDSVRDYTKHRSGATHGQRFDIFVSYLSFAISAAHNASLGKPPVSPILFSDVGLDDDDEEEEKSTSLKRSYADEEGEEDEKSAKKPRK